MFLTSKRTTLKLDQKLTRSPEWSEIKQDGFKVSRVKSPPDDDDDDESKEYA